MILHDKRKEYKQMGNIDETFNFYDNEPEIVNDVLEKDFDDFIDMEEIASLGMDPDNIPERDITKDQAEYYLKTYKNLAQKRDEFQEMHDSKIKAYIQHADKWLEEKLKSIEPSMKFFEEALQDYATQNISGNKKKVSLFEGTLLFSKQQPEFIREDEKIRNFLKEVDGGDEFLDPVPEKIAWGALKKKGEIIDNVFKFNGKMVNGVTVSMRPDKFSIK